MTSRKDFALLRDVLLSLPRPDAATPHCLDDETVAALAEARLAPGACAAALPHLATCRRCSSAVAAVSRALGDRQVAHEIVRAERSRLGRILRFAVPLAAAALVLVMIRPGSDDDRGHRAPTIDPGAAPAPVAPLGSVPTVRALTWTSVLGADRYRVTLFASGGTVLYEVQLADTLAVLPDTLEVAPGRRYLWKVEARADFDRWVTSSLVEFTVSGNRR